MHGNGRIADRHVDAEIVFSAVLALRRRCDTAFGSLAARIADIAQAVGIGKPAQGIVDAFGGAGRYGARESFVKAIIQID